MQVRDVMTRNVISIGSDETVLKAAELMLQNRISGLPVVDATGNLVGVVTEGDFLRRGEIGTQRRRPKWLEFLVGPGRLAADYVQASGRRVEDVMSTRPLTVGEDDSLETVVELMERRHVKRLPVLRDGRMVGIVSRANLMHALASLARDAQAPRAGGDDAAIRERILATLAKQPWAPQVNVVVNRRRRRIVGHHHRRTRTPGAHRRRRKMSPASTLCAIIWSGSSRCPAWRSAPPRTKPRRARRNRRRTPFIEPGAALFLIVAQVEVGTVMHRQKRNALPRSLAAAALAAALLPLSARARSTLSPSEQRGFVFVRTNCARCHAVDKVSPSPLKVAPPFRTLHTAIRSRACRNRSPKASSPAIRRCRNSSSIPARSTT